MDVCRKPCPFALEICPSVNRLRASISSLARHTESRKMIPNVVYYLDSDTYGGCEDVVLLLLSALDKTRWRPILLHDGAPGIATFVNKSDKSEFRAARCRP